MPEIPTMDKTMPKSPTMEKTMPESLTMEKHMPEIPTMEKTIYWKIMPESPTMEKTMQETPTMERTMPERALQGGTRWSRSCLRVQRWRRPCETSHLVEFSQRLLGNCRCL